MDKKGTLCAYSILNGYMHRVEHVHSLHVDVSESSMYTYMEVMYPNTKGWGISMHAWVCVCVSPTLLFTLFNGVCAHTHTQMITSMHAHVHPNVHDRQLAQRMNIACHIINIFSFDLISTHKHAHIQCIKHTHV